MDDEEDLYEDDIEDLQEEDDEFEDIDILEVTE